MLNTADADFIVLVMLNREKTTTPQKTKKKNPDIFVFPIAEALKFKRDDGWHKVMIGKTDCKPYREAWHLIEAFLLQPEHSSQ